MPWLLPAQGSSKVIQNSGMTLRLISSDTIHFKRLQNFSFFFFHWACYFQNKRYWKAHDSIHPVAMNICRAEHRLRERTRWVPPQNKMRSAVYSPNTRSASLLTRHRPLTRQGQSSWGEGRACAVWLSYVCMWEKVMSRNRVSPFLSICLIQLCWRWAISLLWLFSQVNKTEMQKMTLKTKST